MAFAVGDYFKVEMGYALGTARYTHVANDLATLYRSLLRNDAG